MVLRGRRDAGLQLPLLQRLRDHPRARLRQVPSGVAAPDRVGEQQEVAHRVPLAGELSVGVWIDILHDLVVVSNYT